MKFFWKFLATLTTIILIFLFIYLGFVYYLGLKTEESINDEIAILSDNRIFQVDSYQYKRSLFSSEARAKVSIRKNILEMINIDNFPEVLKKVFTEPVILETHIKHGPFVNNLFLRAYAVTDVIFSKDAEQEIVKFFGTKHPFKIENTIQLKGSGILDFTLNSMDYKELSGIQIKFDGLKGQLSYQNNYKEYLWDINIPKFYMKLADKGGLMLLGLTYQSTNQPNHDSIDTGLIELAFDKLSINAKLEDEIKFNLSNIFSFFMNIKLNKLFDPDLSFQAANLSMNHFLFRTNVTQEDQLVKLEGMATFDKLNINHDQYGPLNLKILVNHIDGKALKLLKTYLSELSEKELTIDEWQSSLLNYIRGPASTLFTNNPEFSLKQFYFKMPEGEVKANGGIQFNHLTVEDLSSFSSMINKSYATFDYTLPENLISNIIENQVIGLFLSDKEAPTEQDMKNILDTTKYLVKSFINNNALMHYISLENGIISGTFRMDKGKIYLNGIEYKQDENDIDSIYNENDDKVLNQNKEKKNNLLKKEKHQKTNMNRLKN